YINFICHIGLFQVGLYGRNGLYMTIREPVAAGGFYKGVKNSLLEELEAMIPAIDDKIGAIGAVCPHAGYIYSGAVAGEVYGRLKSKETYIILGPNHTGYGRRFALSNTRWQTPLGVVNIDEELADAVERETVLVVKDSAAHMFEHSIEVQLPFIQKVAPQAEILPMIIGQGSLSELEEVANAIAGAVKNTGRNVIIIASSDMSHYLPRKMAKIKDRLAIDMVLALNAKGLLRVVEENDISMCGYLPAAVMLMAAKMMGAVKGELIKYSDSGEITGSPSEVVGYAGIIVR
ncbi:MAG: AmmeMemoRadiSam system protein B, partial [Candidatus Omnitrophota bacterium]